MQYGKAPTCIRELLPLKGHSLQEKGGKRSGKEVRRGSVKGKRRGGKSEEGGKGGRTGGGGKREEDEEGYGGKFLRVESSPDIEL